MNPRKNYLKRSPLKRKRTSGSFVSGHAGFPKHGMYGTPEYFAWNAAIQRCTNPLSAEYKNYGARGITFCTAWRDFSAFFEYVGPRPTPQHSLGRINNDGNYEPGNVSWETREVQNRNRRDNHWFELDGRRMILIDWAIELGVSAGTLRRRLARYPKEVALTPRWERKINKGSFVKGHAGFPKRDQAYLQWLRDSWPCYICLHWWCGLQDKPHPFWEAIESPSFRAEFAHSTTFAQAAHIGQRGLGQKCSDREAMPLCSQHHLHQTAGGGPESHHTLGKNFWSHHGLERETVIAILNRLYQQETGK